MNENVDPFNIWTPCWSPPIAMYFWSLEYWASHTDAGNEYVWMIYKVSLFHIKTFPDYSPVKMYSPSGEKSTDFILEVPANSVLRHQGLPTQTRVAKNAK